MFCLAQIFFAVVIVLIVYCCFISEKTWGTIIGSMIVSTLFTSLIASRVEVIKLKKINQKQAIILLENNLATATIKIEKKYENIRILGEKE